MELPLLELTWRRFGRKRLARSYVANAPTDVVLDVVVVDFGVLVELVFKRNAPARITGPAINASQDKTKDNTNILILLKNIAYPSGLKFLFRFIYTKFCPSCAIVFLYPLKIYLNVLYLVRYEKLYFAFS